MVTDGLPRRRWWLPLVVGLAMVGVAVAVAVYADRPGQSRAGPLSLGDYFTETGIPVGVGGTATYGSLILRNTGPEVAVIDSVELVPDTEPSAATVVDVRLADVSRSAGTLVGAADTFAPPVYAVPASGARVPGTTGQGQGFQLLFAVRMEHEGTATFSRVRIAYRVGTVHHLLVGEHRLRICAPFRAGCDGS